MTLREALFAMGYQEQKSGIWVKPIGYQMFCFFEQKNKWVNYFEGADNKLHIWNSKIFKTSEKDSYLSQLKELECWSRTDIAANINSQFELTSFDL